MTANVQRDHPGLPDRFQGPIMLAIIAISGSFFLIRHNLAPVMLGSRASFRLRLQSSAVGRGRATKQEIRA